MERELKGSAQEQYVRMLSKSLDSVQRMRIQMGNRIKAFKKNHGEDYGELVDALTTRMWDQADLMERNIAADLAKAVAALPVTKWLEQVKGIGARLSGPLAGVAAPIGKYRTVSAFWSSMGYGVVTVCVECVNLHLVGKERRRFLDRQTQRRWDIYKTSDNFEARVERVGDDPDRVVAFIREAMVEHRAEEYEKSEKQLCSCEAPVLKKSAPNLKYYGGLILPYDPYLKSMCWRIAGQFVRQGEFYREWYDRYKERYQLSCPDLPIGHIDNRARRAMVKLFLSHLWEMWRKAEGLPAGRTYLQEQLGEKYSENHTFIEPPYADTFDKKPKQP